jgi:hypothetical protein
MPKEKVVRKLEVCKSDEMYDHHKIETYVDEDEPDFEMTRYKFKQKPMRAGWGFNYKTWWRDYPQNEPSRGWGSAV